MANGTFANASGAGSSNTASGRDANASGDISTNIASGRSANASGDGSNNIAIGTNANASGDGVRNTSVGTNSVATGANSSAFGGNSAATGANSTAIGFGATATADNQIAIGTATNTVTIAGLPSAASLAAQGPVIGLVTTDALGNLASDGGALQSMVGLNFAGISANSALILGNTAAINDLRSGMAALASIPDLYLQGDETWTAAGGFSAYDDGFGGVKYGFGGGAQFRIGGKGSHVSGGVAGAVSGGTYTARVQLRIGG